MYSNRDIYRVRFKNDIWIRWSFIEDASFEKSTLILSNGTQLELASKELNHLVAILHVYAEGLIFMK